MADSPAPPAADKPAVKTTTAARTGSAASVEAPQDWEDRRAAQVAEYGAWVATAPIYVGNALAYDIGHPVPVSNVERHGYDAAGVVAKRDSKEGRVALGLEV